MTSGGERIAAALARQGVRNLYTLCGGHISPILVGCKRLGIRIVDVRDEKNAVFAADAEARLSGIPGVAAVTAGPGVTNTLTAVQNAMLAESPVVLLGGAAATVLRGRGSLQDIDQMSVVKPHVKWSASVERVADLASTVEEAFARALAGVPGPVFVECPIDLLYGEEVVRDWYLKSAGKGASLAGKAMRWYLTRHVDKLFAGLDPEPGAPARPDLREPVDALVRRAAARVEASERPALLLGSQALAGPGEAAALAAAVERLGIPMWLAGMARGLLGPDHPLHVRHKRRDALREADLVILAGVPADFRLDYGRVIGKDASVIATNLSLKTLFKNKVPSLPIPAHPARVVARLAELAPATPERWIGWRDALRARDSVRDAEIERMAAEEAPPINPLALCRGIERAMSDDATIVADGGDFVATAAYTVRARGPLRWLDPGVFGTLGVGAGFALAAGLLRPGAETWLIYGDGAAGFSLVELDTFCRHGIPVIAVVGNDAGWTQIARDQVVILEDDVGTVLARTDYERVAEGYGAVGLRLDDPNRVDEVLARAKEEAAAGRPVLVNAHIGKTEFRKGSISM